MCAEDTDILRGNSSVELSAEPAEFDLRPSDRGVESFDFGLGRSLGRDGERGSQKCRQSNQMGRSVRHPAADFLSLKYHGGMF